MGHTCTTNINSFLGHQVLDVPWFHLLNLATLVNLAHVAQGGCENSASSGLLRSNRSVRSGVVSYRNSHLSFVGFTGPLLCAQHSSRGWKPAPSDERPCLGDHGGGWGPTTPCQASPLSSPIPSTC